MATFFMLSGGRLMAIVWGVVVHVLVDMVVVINQHMTESDQMAAGGRAEVDFMKEIE